MRRRAAGASQRRSEPCRTLLRASSRRVRNAWSLRAAGPERAGAVAGGEGASEGGGMATEGWATGGWATGGWATGGWATGGSSGRSSACRAGGSEGCPSERGAVGSFCLRVCKLRRLFFRRVQEAAPRVASFRPAVPSHLASNAAPRTPNPQARASPLLDLADVGLGAGGGSLDMLGAGEGLWGLVNSCCLRRWRRAVPWPRWRRPPFQNG